MTNNVNVINNAGSSVDVKVEEKNGAVQILISCPTKRKKLGALQPGDTFKKNDTEYIVCEQLENGMTAVVRKDCLNKTMEFGDDNNWKESKWREYLNNDYMKELEDAFGSENIMEHEVDLLSLDGYDDYGVSVDKVSAMNVDRYRKYHKYIGDTGVSHYLSTPDSTPSGYGSSGVQCVSSVGDVDYCVCDWNRSVRPFFTLKSNIFVSLKEK